MAQATDQGQGFAAQQSTRRTLAELGILLAAAVLLFFAARGCIGCIAERAALALPYDVDAKIGKAAAEQMRQQHSLGKAASEAQQTRVRKVFDELRGALGAGEAEVLENPTITTLADEQINAFALPGGEVFVLTGLLDRVGAGKSGDDMLRGVLAHELGHAVKRHGLRNIARSAAFGIVLALVLGQADQLTGTLVAGAAQLDRLGYSRSMETEADDFGVALLERSGHDVEGLARFLESLDGAPVPQLLSTHPDSKERAERIRARKKGAPAR